MVSVERWIGSARVAEGRAYACEGGLACARNQRIIALCTLGVLAVAHRVEERPEEFVPVVAAKSVEEDVASEVASGEERVPVPEVEVPLFVSIGGDCVDSGLCRAQKSSHEVTSGGSGLIRKVGDTW